ncbi:MAG: hypothetical protein R3C55_06980 [Parvularculaceae bacterium]
MAEDIDISGDRVLRLDGRRAEILTAAATASLFTSATTSLALGLVQMLHASDIPTAPTPRMETRTPASESFPSLLRTAASTPRQTPRAVKGEGLPPAPMPLT